MKGYGQFCPVAMASEVLTERWTPLIVRELLCGSTRFNDLRRGVPLMSPSLLSKRLQTLERVGVVERHCARRGQAGEYRLTPAGQELRPIIESMGIWGQRWARGDVRARHMDASIVSIRLFVTALPFIRPLDRRFRTDPRAHTSTSSTLPGSRPRNSRTCLRVSTVVASTRDGHPAPVWAFRSSGASSNSTTGASR